MYSPFIIVAWSPLKWLCFCQASRARQLGATVYCVGVKDFNETQVNPSTHHITTHQWGPIDSPVCSRSAANVPPPAVDDSRREGPRVPGQRRLPGSAGDHRLGMTSAALFVNCTSVLHVLLFLSINTDGVVFHSFLKILKRSCIEILAVEPSSVCRGGMGNL